MLYQLMVNQGYAVCHKEIVKTNRADLMLPCFSSQYPCLQEECAGSLAAAMAGILIGASCVRVNDASSLVFASKVSSKVGLYMGFLSFLSI